MRIGTRRSALAMAQTQWTVDALADRGTVAVIVPLAVAGDDASRPVAEIGVDAYVGALRAALLAGDIDVAVHSYKDLPTAALPELVVAAVPTREDARDALVARDGLTLGELLPGSRVGTGSARRTAQLHALGLDLDVVPIRGNVDSRLARVGADLDAVVVAHAGLKRLGRASEATEVLDPLQMLPCPAQGALALECRSADEQTRSALAPLDDPSTHACVLAERALLAALEAGCSSAVGAWADAVEGDEGDEIWLRGIALAPNGWSVRLSQTGTILNPHEVGQTLAQRMLEDGAAELLQAKRQDA